MFDSDMPWSESAATFFLHDILYNTIAFFGLPGTVHLYMHIDIRFNAAFTMISMASVLINPLHKQGEGGI